MISGKNFNCSLEFSGFGRIFGSSRDHEVVSLQFLSFLQIVRALTTESESTPLFKVYSIKFNQIFDVFISKLIPVCKKTNPFGLNFSQNVTNHFAKNLDVIVSTKS